MASHFVTASISHSWHQFQNGRLCHFNIQKDLARIYHDTIQVFRLIFGNTQYCGKLSWILGWNLEFEPSSQRNEFKNIKLHTPEHIAHNSRRKISSVHYIFSSSQQFMLNRETKSILNATTDFFYCRFGLLRQTVQSSSKKYLPPSLFRRLQWTYPWRVFMEKGCELSVRGLNLEEDESLAVIFNGLLESDCSFFAWITSIPMSFLQDWGRTEDLIQIQWKKCCD